MNPQEKVITCRTPAEKSHGLYMLEPFQLKSMVLRNRIVLPPMDLYSATASGLPGEVHFTHYVARAMGGVGLLIMEATAVQPNGRISDHCLGLWDDRQGEALMPIVKNCQKYGAKVAVQLNHAGRKCSAKSEARIFGPSAIKFSEDYKTPCEISEEEINEVVNAFQQSAKRADHAGFDAIEVHGAHGYLISSFLSPLTNKRTDAYGGSMENRCRLLKEVLAAIRKVWPENKPVMLRVSASDYLDKGIQLQDMVSIINYIHSLVDIVNVSSGGVETAPITSYPGYQVGFSETIRRSCSMPTIVAGLVTEASMVEEILGNGRADLVALGRALFREPNWVHQVKRNKGLPYDGPDFYREAFEARL